MTQKTCEYPYWIDLAWFASDCNGHVGAFTTGGEGPIPARVLNNEALSYDDVGGHFRRLPPVSGFHLLVSMKRPDDYIEIAERGLFAYDWRDVERVRVEETHMYEPVSAPARPITLDELPELLRDYVRQVRLDGIAFSEGKSLDVTSLLDCCCHKQGGG